MAHNARKLKYEILQSLEKYPFLDAAARKIGIGRTTLYRWMHTDKKFKRKVELAMYEGRKKVNEVVEGSLIKTAQNGNVRAQMFYLRNQHPDYMYKKLQSSILSHHSSINYWVPNDPSIERKNDRFRTLVDDMFNGNEIDATSRILMKVMIENGTFEKWLEDHFNVDQNSSESSQL